MSSLIQDLKVSVRSLAARRGFTAVAVLTLALGLGATTALFSVVHAVLLRSLPYPDPDRIVALWETSRDNPGVSQGGTTSHLNYLDWKARARSFEAMALYAPTNRNVTGLGEAEMVPSGIVTPDFFRAFGSPPFMGREFTVEDDRPGAPEVVIVSDGFWRERLGARQDVLGSRLEISGRAAQIVGVAPPGFDFPNRARLWLPVRNDDTECGRRCIYLDGVARLAPGASFEAARDEMTAIARALEAEYPAENTNVTVGTARLRDLIVGDVRPALLMLLGAVAMVLLIACANVANLLLVRGAARQDEIAIRAALGAGRLRLVRLLLTESAVLAIAGAGCGLLVGWWAMDILKQLAPASIPRLAEAGFDLTTFAFAFGLALMTALLFGLGPAVHVIRRPITTLLGARGETGGARSRWSRSTLLAAEVALSVMLLAGAGLMVRSMARLQAVEPGWQSEGIITFTTSLPSARYPETADVVRGFDEIGARLRAVPGVERVGRITGLPLSPTVMVLAFERPDLPEPAPGQGPTALFRPVDAEYLHVAGIPLLNGRHFGPEDGASGQPTVIISREMAEQYWPGEDPVGRQLQIGSTPRTIVGIVGGVRSTNLSAPPEPEMYVPDAQASSRSTAFVLKSSLPPGQVLRAARETVRDFDRLLPVFRAQPWSVLEDQALARPRFYLALLGVLAMLAVTLAAVGVYGVVAYAVSQRRREIGLRMALGAGGADVVRLVVWQGLRPVSIGTAVGIAGALAGGRFLADMLYEIPPRDPSTMMAVVVLLMAIAIVACAIPAWAATRIPPASALRAE
jgi:putative ABC transport system permease protein